MQQYLQCTDAAAESLQCSYYSGIGPKQGMLWTWMEVRFEDHAAKQLLEL